MVDCKIDQLKYLFHFFSVVVEDIYIVIIFFSRILRMIKKINKTYIYQYNIVTLVFFIFTLLRDFTEEKSKLKDMYSREHSTIFVRNKF